MEIDTTLNSLLLPFMPTYQNEIGTKKLKEGLTTEECADTALRPFRQQRPFLVSEDSETTEIQANCSFVVTTAGVTLTLNDAFFPGCEVTVANLSDGDIIVKGGVSGLNGGVDGISLAKGLCVQFLFYNGWRSLTGSNGQGCVTLPVVSTAESVHDTTELVVRDTDGNLLIKTISSLWSYVQNKIDSVLKLSSSGYSGTAAVASKVKTVSTSTDATRYLTFVDSNNASATDESVYTASGITYNPSTNSLTVSGKIEGGQLVIPINKPSSVVAGSIWLS